MNKECYTCKNERLEIDQEPCASCEKHSAWAQMGIQIKLERRAEMLPKPLPIYERTDSRIPERVRISFTDGTSAIYDLHTEQPAPIIIENIKIIRRMAEYTAPRPRRRSRK